VGATGAIIMVKLLYELQRIGGRYGLSSGILWFDVFPGAATLVRAGKKACL